MDFLEIRVKYFFEFTSLCLIHVSTLSSPLFQPAGKREHEITRIIRIKIHQEFTKLE